MAKPLTHAQIGQLGGFASARAVGHEAIVERGSKGGDTTLARYGREHYIRAAHARWGRLKSTKKGVVANEENNMVLVEEKARPRNTGKDVTGPLSSADSTNAA